MAVSTLRIRSVLLDSLHVASVPDWLVERVRLAVQQGRAEPVVVVLRERTLDAIAVRELQRLGVPVPWFVAGLTTSSTEVGGKALAVGLTGQVGRRVAGEGELQPAATVFLEWEDGRWWQWSASVEEDAIVQPTAMVLGAAAGDPLPEGLGRWWSAGRRHGVSLGLQALGADPTGGVEQ